MGIRLADAVVTFTGDMKPLESAIKSAEDSTKKSAEQIEKAMLKAAKSFEGSAASVEKLKAKVAENSAALDKAKTALDAAKAGVDTTGKSVEKLEREFEAAQNAVLRSEKSLGLAERRMETSKQAVARLNDEMKHHTTGVQGWANRISEAQERIQAKWGKIFDGMRTAGMWLSGAGAIVGAGMYKIVESATEAGSKINDLSIKTGLSAESLSKWGYALKLGGGSVEVLDKAIKGMNRSLFEASRQTENATQKTGELDPELKGIAEGYQVLGLKAKELMALPMDKRFEAIAFALSRIEDPGERAAIAMKVFGRSGDELLTVLNEGESAIRSYFKELEAAGGVWSDEQAAQADAYGDAVAALQTALGGLGKEFVVTFLPAIKGAVDGIRGFVIAMREFIQDHPLIAGNIGKIAIAFVGLSAVLGPLLITLPGLVTAFTVFKAAIGVGGVTTALQGMGAAALGCGGATSGLLALLTGPVGLAVVTAAAGYQVYRLADAWIAARNAEANAQSLVDSGMSQREKLMQQMRSEGYIIDEVAFHRMDAARQNDYLQKVAVEQDKNVLRQKTESAQKENELLDMKMARHAEYVRLVEESSTREQNAMREVLLTWGNSLTVNTEQRYRFLQGLRSDMDAAHGQLERLSLDSHNSPSVNELSERSFVSYLSKFESMISSLWSMVNSVVSRAWNALSALGNKMAGIGSVQRRSAGGPIFGHGAIAPAIINEQGPEIVTTPSGENVMFGGAGAQLVGLPVGSFVHTAEQTRRMLGFIPAFAAGGTVGQDTAIAALKMDAMARLQALFNAGLVSVRTFFDAQRTIFEPIKNLMSVTMDGDRAVAYTHSGGSVSTPPHGLSLSSMDPPTVYYFTQIPGYAKGGYVGAAAPAGAVNVNLNMGPVNVANNIDVDLVVKRMEHGLQSALASKGMRLVRA